MSCRHFVVSPCLRLLYFFLFLSRRLPRYTHFRPVDYLRRLLAVNPDMDLKVFFGHQLAPMYAQQQQQQQQQVGVPVADGSNSAQVRQYC